MKTYSLLLILFSSFYFWCPEGTSATELPDLNVTHISRNPLYYNYHVIYPSGIPTLMPGTEDDKHWPDSGEIVTFTATVINKGGQASPAYGFHWIIDGMNVESGDMDSLGVGEMDSTSIQWAWQGWGHEIEFIVDSANQISESCEGNNRVHDRIDALGLWIFLTRQAYDYYQSWPNMLGSYSAEDWVKSNIDTMNISFANAIYPLTPQGALERVRIDRFIVYEEGNAPYPPSDWRLKDGEWGFSYTGMDSSYFLRTDWGLIHEICHQLGRIDIYQIGIGPSGNKVLDQSGLPVGIGTGDKPLEHALMFDMSPFLSEHTAYSFNRDLHKRRGYYGEYLLDIPSDNRVRVWGRDQLPLIGATVRAYRKEFPSGEIPNTPFAEGITDSNGIFSIGEKPYGDWIDIVGTNGLLFLAISFNGHSHYEWITILESNLAFWNGDSLAAVYDIRTTIPDLDAPAAPYNLRTASQHHHTETTIDWDHDTTGIRIYRIYRCDCIMNGQFYPVYPMKLVDSTTENTLNISLSGGGYFYCITAVDTQDVESGFSNEILVLPWYGLRGIVISSKGARYISSYHYSEIFIQDIRGFNTRAFIQRSEPKTFWNFYVDEADTVYLFDNEAWMEEEYNFGMRKYAPDGSFVSKFGHRGSGPGFFQSVTDVDMDRDRNLMILDNGNHCIQAFHNDGTFIAMIGSEGSGEGQFQSPRACAFDQNSRHLLVADTENDRVVILDFDGTAFSFIQTISHDSLQQPVDVAFDASGRIVIAEKTELLVFDQLGILLEIIHQSNDQYHYNFLNIQSIAIDAENNIFIVDEASSCILAVSPEETPQPANSLPLLSLISDSSFRLSIEPDSGDITQSFTFRVRYSDYDNDPPLSGCPVIRFDFNGDGDCIDTVGQIAEGSFAMQPATSGMNHYSQGVYYDYATALPASGAIHFKFAAWDANGAEAIAQQPALDWQSGPYVFASQLRVADDSIPALLQPGQSTVKTITLYNSETMPVQFEINPVDSLFHRKYQPSLPVFKTAQSAQWITIDPASGTVSGRDSIRITLTLSAAGYNPGAEDQISLVISSPDSTIYSVALPVFLHVADEHSNLAFGGGATAVSWPARLWEPGYAVDGDTTTVNRFWRTRYYPFTLLEGDWWQVKMNETYWINKIAIYQGQGADADFFVKFHIETSLSGEFQGEQDTIAIINNWGVISQNLKKAVFEVEPLQTRYIRLVNDLMKDWVALQEVQVFYTLATDLLETATPGPAQFELFPAFPNPFNIGTMIGFYIPRMATCQIEIYNLYGELVIKLIDRTLGAGRHQIWWDGRNQRNRPVASGVYFCRLQSGAFGQKIGKLLLIK